MKIKYVVLSASVENKIEWKHHVTGGEVKQVFLHQPKFRFIEKGKREGEHVYMALGQTDAGRFLSVLFIYKKRQRGKVISARDMILRERRLYVKR